jgi:hypothetical protein
MGYFQWQTLENNRRGNQEWTIKIHCQQRTHRTHETQHNTEN